MPQTRSVARETAQSLGEEIANAATHGLGAVLGLVALVVLVLSAVETGDPLRVVGAAVFGASLVLLYLASTLYHAVRSPAAKRVLKILDHAGIYILIAGTYTPFTLVTLHGPWGWSILGLIWALAVAGVAMEASWVDRPKWISALVFVGMGWIIVVAMGPLMEALTGGGLALLVAGGVAYTGGTVFYVLKRVRYMHAVWHLWVLAGSTFHVLSVWLHVMPVPA